MSNVAAPKTAREYALAALRDAWGDDTMTDDSEVGGSVTVYAEHFERAMAAARADALEEAAAFFEKHADHENEESDFNMEQKELLEWVQERIRALKKVVSK